VAEKAETITEYFIVNSGYLWKELSVEYHFSTELRGMLSLVFSPTTSINVTSTSGSNKADNVVFNSALDLNSFFPADSETVPKPGKGTNTSTQQSKPSPKVSQSSVIRPPDESIQLKSDSNIKQTKPCGKRRKGIIVPLISKKLPAALQAHQG